VAKLTNTGTLDSSFGTKGELTFTYVSGGIATAEAGVVIDPANQEIIVGGLSGPSPFKFGVARVTPTGGFDGAFAGGGRTTFAVADGSTGDVPFDLTLDEDRRIVVAGFSQVVGSQRFGVVRLTPTGGFDGAFAGGGRTVFTSPGSTANAAQAVDTDAANNIYLAGYTVSAGSLTQMVAKLTPGGIPDAGFGTGGFFTGGVGSAQGVGVQRDGKVAVASYSPLPGGTSDFDIIRLDTLGRLDTTFHPTGPTPGRNVFDLGANQADLPTELVIDGNGRLLVAGYNNSTQGIEVARLEGPQVGLRVTLSDNETQVHGGEVLEYTLVVTNTGPDVVTGSELTLTPSANFAGATFEFESTASPGAGGNTPTGTGLPADTLTLPAGASVTYTITVAAPAAPGIANLSAAVSVPAGVLDTDAADNTAADADAILPTVALAATVTNGSATVVAGGPATYTVVVTNAGPDPATGAKVAAVLPAGLTGVTFTSAAAGGAIGNTASGSGPILDTLTLPAGASVTYTVIGTLHHTATGTATASVVVTAPDGAFEAEAADNSAADTDAVLPPPQPTLVGGATDGTAVPLNPSGGRYAPAPSRNFFPGLGVTVRTATADVTGDGTPDYVGGTGPNAATRVAVIDGKTGAVVGTVQPFEASFTGGVFVAAADLDGDGKAEVVVSPDQGGGPVVAVYSGAKLSAGLTGDAAQLTRFFGIEDPAFRGGARPTLGDVNGDGTPDLVVSAGFLGGPRIAIFDGKGLAAGSTTPAHLVPDFFAFEDTLRNGAFVAAGDVDADGSADIAFGGGPDGAPRVRVFDGKQLLAAGGFTNLDDIGAAQRANFFAGSSDLRGGVRLAMRDADGDGRADLVTGSGEGESSRVRLFKSAALLGGPTPVPDQELDPFGGAVLTNGVFVG
jgi:uncharacterized repeat protein (TIGR01451 family)/uncharacterized delta-60 repeat protein